MDRQQLTTRSLFLTYARTDKGWRGGCMGNHDESDALGKCENHCRRIQVPTEEELAALNAMRAIRGEAKLLKERLKTLSDEKSTDSFPERIALQEKMDRFKVEWNGWEEKRKAAAKRRMVLLGHEEPDPEDQWFIASEKLELDR
jgi:hypothetical protein